MINLSFCLSILCPQRNVRRAGTTVETSLSWRQVLWGDSPWNFRSPCDSVIFSVIARAAPKSPVVLVDKNRGDRPRSLFCKIELVAHALELPAHPRGHFVVEGNTSGFGFVFAE